MQESLKNLEREPNLAHSFSQQETLIRKVWSRIILWWSLRDRGALLPDFGEQWLESQYQSILSTGFKASHSLDAKVFCKVPWAMGLPWVLSLIVVRSFYKASLTFPLIHTEGLLPALLTALHVCFPGRDSTGNTVLALNCAHRNKSVARLQMCAQREDL